MPANWSTPSFLLAAGLEAWAALLLLGGESGFAVVALLHLLASLLGALATVARVPLDYEWERKFHLIGLFFALAACMPLFGLAGLALSILPALHRPKRRREIQWKGIALPELPFKPVLTSGRPSYGEGGLSSVLRSAGDPERRIRAVIAARQITDKLAVPLLQEALKDPVDDVRLFAYSVLDSKETHINDRIGELLSDLNTRKEQDKARTHYALAQNYWEMAFLGLATGSTYDYVLDKAEEHATLAADMGWSGPDIEFLIGRIKLRQQKYAEAETTFKSAVEHGALESAILPFLAEIAFEKRDFVTLRADLDRLNRSCNGHPPIPAVVQTWQLA